MTTVRIPAQSRITLFFICVCLVPIVSQGWRFLEIVPRWLGDLPPAYPGQYQVRALGAAVALGLAGAAIVSALTGRVSRRAQFAFWSLLTAGAVALVAQWATMG
jgi:hypothetical protein